MLTHCKSMKMPDTTSYVVQKLYIKHQQCIINKIEKKNEYIDPT